MQLANYTNMQYCIIIQIKTWVKPRLLVSQSLNWVNCTEKIGLCPFHTKNPTFWPLSQTNQGNAPILKLDFLKIELKKKKFMEFYNDILRTYSDVLELDLHELELHAIFFLFFTYNSSSGSSSSKMPLQVLKMSLQAP